MDEVIPPVPDFVHLDVRLSGGSLEHWLGHLLRAFEKTEWHAPVSWAAPIRPKLKAVPKGGIVQALSSEKPGKARPESVVLGLSDRVRASLYRAEPGWEARVNVLTGGAEDEVRAAVRQLLQVCRELLPIVGVAHAQTRWAGHWTNCAPNLPLFDRRSQVVIVSEDELEKEVDDVGAFFGSGWEEVVRSGSRALCIRGRDAGDGVALLEAILDHQWTLARMSSPGRCQFYTPSVHPLEEPIYRRGEQTLLSVGYIDAEKTAELSCAILDDRHVSGWEIFSLHDMIADKALPDGRPVATTRVVFLDAGVARRERRPLLDAGARVFAYESSGDLVEIPPAGG